MKTRHYGLIVHHFVESVDDLGDSTDNFGQIVHNFDESVDD